MQETKESFTEEYRAVQVGQTVYVIASGKNPHNRYEVGLVEVKAVEEISAVPPQFQLTRKELNGRVVKIPTKFAVYDKFTSETPVEYVTIRDAENEHRIVAEQTPDFQIEPAINKLLKKENIRYKKVSAALLSLVNEYETAGTIAAVYNSSPASVTPLSIPSLGGTPETVIFIRCDENAEIDVPGVHVNSEKGKIRTAKVSLDALEKLSKHSQVQRLSASVKLKPLNDLAAQKTHLNNFRFNHDPKLTGKDVIIGIIDSGIDSLHPAFGQRILSIWDQTIKGTGWEAKNYGQILTETNLSQSVDSLGHGTHVAGIAAGNDVQFGGVAPEASLIIVKTDFNDAHVMDGIEYIFAEADRLEQPAVVNISLGHHINAHDGTDCLSEFIDSQSREGRIIVAAAGNDAANNIHAKVAIAPGVTEPVRFTIPQAPEAQLSPTIFFSGWYSADGDCQISVRPPNADPTPFQPVIKNGNPTRIHPIGETEIYLTTPPATSSHNGDHGFYLKMQGRLQPGEWQILINNSGTSDVSVDIWSEVPFNFSDVLFYNFVDNDMKIGTPGSAAEAITVGAYVSKNKWTPLDGIETTNPTFPDVISSFSSPGPTRDGKHPKPDIVAPGENIISTRSRNSTPPNAFLLQTDDFVVNVGTSMACSFITGICALLLQKDKTYTSAGIKDFLKERGRIPQQPPQTHDNKWGFGLITFNDEGQI